MESSPCHLAVLSVSPPPAHSLTSDQTFVVGTSASSPRQWAQTSDAVQLVETARRMAPPTSDAYDASRWDPRDPRPGTPCQRPYRRGIAVSSTDHMIEGRLSKPFRVAPGRVNAARVTGRRSDGNGRVRLGREVVRYTLKPRPWCAWLVQPDPRGSLGRSLPVVLGPQRTARISDAGSPPCPPVRNQAAAA